MKISSVETFTGWAGWCNWTFLRMETDSGLVGWGEASLHGSLSAVESAVQELSAVLVGHEFAGVEASWQRMYHAWRWRGGVVSNTALSGLDLALWDLEAKALGIPVHRLLGGALRESVPVYSSHHLWRSPEQAAAETSAALQRGHTALKWALLSIWDNRDVASSIAAAVDITGAAREAAGPSFQLFIDCSEVLTTESAMRLATALEPYGIGFLEEPLPFENPRAMLDLARRLPIAIATGERLLSRWEFRELIEGGGIAVLQPDLMHAGGLTEVRKIATAADTYYLPIAPHNAGGPISTAAAIHLGLAIPNFFLLETMDDERNLRDEICVEPIGFEPGAFAMPTGPGFGVELDVDRLRERRYRPAPVGKAPPLWLT